MSDQSKNEILTLILTVLTEARCIAEVNLNIDSDLDRIHSEICSVIDLVNESIYINQEIA